MANQKNVKDHILLEHPENTDFSIYRFVGEKDQSFSDIYSYAVATTIKYCQTTQSPVVDFHFYHILSQISDPIQSSYKMLKQKSFFEIAPWQIKNSGAIYSSNDSYTNPTIDIYFKCQKTIKSIGLIGRFLSLKRSPSIIGDSQSLLFVDKISKNSAFKNKISPADWVYKINKIRVFNPLIFKKALSKKDLVEVELYRKGEFLRFRALKKDITKSLLKKQTNYMNKWLP